MKLAHRLGLYTGYATIAAATVALGWLLVSAF